MSARPTPWEATPEAQALLADLTDTGWTKGPWRIVSEREYELKVKGPEDELVADCADCFWSDDGWIMAADSEANARLIAAAPELYEALATFERQWNACGPNSDFGRYFQSVRDVAVSALSKADAGHWVNTSQAALAKAAPPESKP